MAHRYSQSTGEWTLPSGERLGFGFAGRQEGLNSPAHQFVFSKGPLPQGTYDMTAWLEKDAALGLCVIVLRERPGTKFDNRQPGTFRVHGPKSLIARGLTAFLESSEGCICIGDCVSRRNIWHSGDRVLEVVA